MTPVRFTVLLARGADAKALEDSLNAICQELHVHVVPRLRLPLDTLEGVTNQQTYERIFNARLQYHGDQWQELGPAHIPDQLRDLISEVRVVTEYKFF